MATTMLSSLGVTPKGEPYSETEYRFGNQSIRSSFCSLALCLMMKEKPEKLVLLLTSKARTQHQELLREKTQKNGILLEIIDIPDCATESEIWKTFEIMVDYFWNLPEPPNVILDITNGFRHLPLLLFSGVEFLDGS